MTTYEFNKQQYRDDKNLQARLRLHRLYSTNPYGWYRWYLDQAGIPENGRCLELGCGPAALWQSNLGRIPSGARLLLTDFSPGMVRQAKQNIVDDRFTFAVVDAQSIPFPTASFDVILANHMLYHVPDRDRAIAEIRRVLRPGGRLYAATNGLRHMAEMDELVDRLAPTFSVNKGLPGLTSAFTLENGGEQLEKHFKSVRMERYADGLTVTEAQPFVDYVLSMSTNAQREFLREEIANFIRLVEEWIQQEGAIRILKDAGVFIAA